MALINKLSAIGEAIREKTGKTELLTLDVMPEEIRSIETGGGGGGDITPLVDGTFNEVYANNDITYIRSGAFQDTKITEINCPNVATMGWNTFQSCQQLVEVNLPKVRQTGGNSFYGCQKLKIVNMPELQNISAYEFQGTAIESVSFPKLQSMASDSFNSCRYLKEINIPVCEVIESSALQYCYELEELILPNVIFFNGWWAIANCEKLKKVDLYKLGYMKPNTSWSCGILVGYTFENCYKLDTLILRYPDKIAELEDISAFSNTPIGNGTGYIYVPRALIEDYKVATNWVTFADQFRAIEDYPDICGEEVV